MYPKIVTGKVQVAYFENVFSDWSIFKEAVFLTTACNTSCFMSTPRCFPFRDIFFVLKFIHIPMKVTGGKEARSSISLGNRILFFVMTITVKKKTKYH